MELKNTIKIASIALDDVKLNVRGIFKEKGSNLELVTDIFDGAINTVTITEFGAVQYNQFRPVQNGKLAVFPNGRNLRDMLSDPIALDNFLKQFN